MTESDIFNAIGPLVGGRVYPDVAEIGKNLPIVIWQQVGGDSVNYLGNEFTDKKNARIQITVYGKTRIEVMDLIRDIENILVVNPIYAEAVGAAFSTYDEATKMRGATQDFSVWITH